MRLWKALAKALVKLFRFSAGRIWEPVRHGNHFAHTRLANRRRRAERITVKRIEPTLVADFFGGLDQKRQIIAPITRDHRLRAAGFDLHGIRNEVLHPAQSMQLIAYDLHIRPLQSDLFPGFTQHTLPKAVVLSDQVNAFQCLVVFKHLHQRSHAHVGMRVEAEMPVAAFFVRQRRIHRRVIQKKHALGRLTFVVFVDGVNQHGSSRRRVSLCNYRDPVVNRRTQRRQRLFVLPLAVIALNAHRSVAARQLHAAARIDALGGPDQIAKNRLARVSE